MVGGEEDESSEGDGMIYFFSSPLVCAEGKGRRRNCGTKLVCVWKEPCI